jgi:uncharacterized membrane protein YqjE
MRDDPPQDSDAEQHADPYSFQLPLEDVEILEQLENELRVKMEGKFTLKIHIFHILFLHVLSAWIRVDHII